MLYPLATWLAGFVIERHFDDAIAQVRETATYASVVEHQFRRGWYTSQADMTLEFFHDVPAALPGAAARASAPLRMTIRSVIHHGPICGADCIGLARVDTRIVFSDQVRSAIAKIFGPLDPLNARSRLGFFGGGSTLFSSPPAKEAKLDDGTIVSWGGLQASVSYGAGVDTYTVHGNAPRAIYSAPDGGRFEARDALFDSQAKRALRTLYAGDSSFSLAHAAFAGAGGAGPLSIDDLRFTSRVGADAGFLAMSMKLSSGSIVKAPVALTGTHFDVTFRHLEMESLDQLATAVRELNQDRTLTPAARTEKMLPLLKQQGARLLIQQPQIAFDQVSIANAGGAAMLKGLLQMPGVTSADFADGASPKGMIQKLDADLDLSVDEALLKILPGGVDGAMQLQRLTSQGLLTQENGRFHTRILFHRGQLTFNGKPFRPGGQ